MRTPVLRTGISGTRDPRDDREIGCDFRLTAEGKRQALAKRDEVEIARPFPKPNAGELDGLSQVAESVAAAFNLVGPLIASEAMPYLL